jgi:hypothetical protein
MQQTAQSDILGKVSFLFPASYFLYLKKIAAKIMFA